MKFTSKNVPQGKNILANDHYVAIPYDCSALTSLATDGVIPEGTIIPKNDATAIGVLLNPVVLAENPNGTVVIHGFIRKEKLPTAPATAAMTAMSGIAFLDVAGIPVTSKCTLTYDLNGATGTAVTDSSSPYTYGTEVTVKTAPTITSYPESTTKFKEWNTKADGTGTSYAASAKLTIKGNTKLYAIYEA